MFCCQRLFTITARCGDILGPCSSSSAKSLESCSRKRSVETFRWRFYQPNLCCLGNFWQQELSNLIIKMVLVWDADTIIWNFIIIRGINISVALLGISSGNSMVFLHNTLSINPGVSTTMRSHFLSWRFFIR